MLKTIREFGKSLVIAGVRNVSIGDPTRFLKTATAGNEGNVEIQLFDAGLVATWEHLYFAALNALTAFKNGENISKTLAMETMLYVSAQHQIARATALAGIKTTSTEVALLIIGATDREVESAYQTLLTRIHAEANDGVLEIASEKVRTIRKTFGISDAELETARRSGEREEKALANLVIERMAMLAAQH